MVVPSPLGWEPIPSRPRSAWRWAAAAVAVLIAAVIAAHSIGTDYYALVPGSAQAVNGPDGVVSVKSSHLGQDDLFLTTVGLVYRVTLWQRLMSWAHPDIAFVKKTVLTQGASTAQFQQQSVDEMSTAEEQAQVAALRRLGYKVAEHGDGAIVFAIYNGPNASKFVLGDVITKIDGKPIKIQADAIAAIRSHPPGDSVNIEVRRPGRPTKTVDLQVSANACGPQDCPNAPNRPVVGLALGTDNDHFDIPPQLGLKIDAGPIGGPSAGLAFALGVLDSLTTRNITGGNKVAVTGTIDADGNVGPVGGVTQKTIAVERAGIHYFLVPPDEFDGATAQARGHHLTVVKVATLNDALTFLRTIGGNLAGIPAH